MFARIFQRDRRSGGQHYGQGEFKIFNKPATKSAIFENSQILPSQFRPIFYKNIKKCIRKRIREIPVKALEAVEFSTIIAKIIQNLKIAS